jgi:hypothetical protein
VLFRSEGIVTKRLASTYEHDQSSGKWRTMPSIDSRALSSVGTQLAASTSTP